MKPIQVLLADDEEEFVATLAERLIMRGIDASWVTTAAAACEKLRHQRYEVAVLDIKLPGISGFDLQRKMAQLAPEMKFLFMTGHGSPGAFTENHSDAEFYDYLVKPVDIDQLIERIEQLSAQQQ